MHNLLPFSGQLLGFLIYKTIGLSRFHSNVPIIIIESRKKQDELYRTSFGLSTGSSLLHSSYLGDRNEIDKHRSYLGICGGSTNRSIFFSFNEGIIRPRTFLVF